MANAQHRAKKSKKNRKHGRNASNCLVYRNSRKEDQNKLVKLKRHLKAFPDDVVAKEAVIACKTALGMKV